MIQPVRKAGAGFWLNLRVSRLLVDWSGSQARQGGPVILTVVLPVFCAVRW